MIVCNWQQFIMDSLQENHFEAGLDGADKKEQALSKPDQNSAEQSKQADVPQPQQKGAADENRSQHKQTNVGQSKKMVQSSEQSLIAHRTEAQQKIKQDTVDLTQQQSSAVIFEVERTTIGLGTRQKQSPVLVQVKQQAAQEPTLIAKKHPLMAGPKRITRQSEIKVHLSGNETQLEQNKKESIVTLNISKQEQKQIHVTLKKDIIVFQQAQGMRKSLTESVGSSVNEKTITLILDNDMLEVRTQSIRLQKSSVEVHIKDAVEKGFALNKQTYFHITGQDKHGPFDVSRHMGEFQSLRKILLERWPGCFVPQLSQRSELSSEARREMHRRRKLENFLRKLSCCEQIYYKEEVQLFLRGLGIDIQEMFTQMPTLKVGDIIERLILGFEQASKEAKHSENEAYIAQTSGSLKKISSTLGNLQKKALKLAESYQLYKQMLPKFSSFLCRYEQTCLSEYTGNPDCFIAIRESEGKLSRLQVLREKQNLFYQLYFMFEEEQRDAESLSEIALAMGMFTLRLEEIEQKQKEMQVELDSLAQGAKKLITRKPKEQLQVELAQKIHQLETEKQRVQQVHGIAQAVLANETIPRFKKNKANIYFELIKKWVDTSNEANTQGYEVWKFLDEEVRSQLSKYEAQKLYDEGAKSKLSKDCLQ